MVYLLFIPSVHMVYRNLNFNANQSVLVVLLIKYFEEFKKKCKNFRIPFS